MQVSRQEVYKALDSERDYQEALKESSGTQTTGDQFKTVPDFLIFIEEYLDKAKRVWANDWTPECKDKTLAEVRKLTALGVACMENNGAPLRVPVTADQAKARVSS